MAANGDFGQEDVAGGLVVINNTADAGAAFAPTAVNDPLNSPDDVTTHIEFTKGTRWSFLMTTPASAGATNIGTISNLFIQFRMARKGVGGGHGDGNVFFRRAGVNYDQAAITLSNATYTTFSTTLPTDPTTGVAWSPIDFNLQTLQIGFYSAPTSTNALFLTQLYVKMTYTPLAWSAALPAAASTWTTFVGGQGANEWAAVVTGTSFWSTVAHT